MTFAVNPRSARLPLARASRMPTSLGTVTFSIVIGGVVDLLENVDSGDQAVLEELFHTLREADRLIRYISRRTLGYGRSRNYFSQSPDRQLHLQSPHEMAQAVEESRLENEG